MRYILLSQISILQMKTLRVREVNQFPGSDPKLWLQIPWSFPLPHCTLHSGRRPCDAHLQPISWKYSYLGGQIKIQIKNNQKWGYYLHAGASGGQKRWKGTAVCSHSLSMEQLQGLPLPISHHQPHPRLLGSAS